MTIVQVTIAPQTPVAVVTIAPNGTDYAGTPLPAPEGLVLTCTLP